MAARPRDAKNRPLPPNLYGPSKAGGSYMWRNPMTGKKASAGTDKKSAVRRAIQANAELAAIRSDREVSILARMSGEALRTVGEWCDAFQAILDKRKLSDQTRAGKRAMLNTLKAKLNPDRLLADITTLDIAGILKGYQDQGKDGMARNQRSLMLDMFREACAAGWISSNPVDVTKASRGATKRERLTLADALSIRAHMSGWALNAFDLALITGQRREDVAAMSWPKEGFLEVVQIKTGARIRIPLGLFLPALKLTLGDVAARCRDAVVSPTLLHFTKNSGRARPGGKIDPGGLSAAFADARKLAEIGGEHPPTFHELRSLSLRLWADLRGKDFAQALGGHKTAAMAATYQDNRGAEWVTVSA